MKTGKICIGIDPGKQTGVAISMGGRLIKLLTLDFWSAYALVCSYPISSIQAVIIEDTSDLPVFHKGAKTWGGAAATGRRVGAVCREADLLFEGLKRAGYNVIKRQGKVNRKLNAKQFNSITGWTGKSNQHQRDAGTLLL